MGLQFMIAPSTCHNNFIAITDGCDRY